MPKGSQELTNARKEEIINACEKLYKTMSFKEITIKEIGNITSFTRTSIYNYFNTKEEIFLELLKREYMLWIDELKSIIYNNTSLLKTEFADKFAISLSNRPLMLKILSMNHYDMESGSRPEFLTEFKLVYGQTISTVTECLEKFFSSMTVQDIQGFIYAFFPFLFGIYPYTTVNEKQKSAMKAANIDFVFMTVYDITYNFIMRVLN
ncbi:MAG: TetR/AcrR family transcriptional regulator [Acutalibacteraceae bacterium]